MDSVKRKLLLILLLTIFPFVGAQAQICQIEGVVKDKESQIPLPQTNITYRLDNQTQGVSTNDEGRYVIQIPRGSNITLKASRVGYKPTSKTINGQKAKIIVDIDMLSESTTLHEAVVEGRVPLLKMRGDTAVYYAAAYKVNSDASAYDLISQKLPGVGMKDGKLEAHGQEVKNIMIDGHEYYKGDINMALKNLPANIIDEIQVFDQLSDYAQLTGFDDGNTNKAINIKTKKGTTQSQFGKGYVGYGLEDTYKAYGMYNLFKDDLRLSLFVQLNNINEQNFSMIDLLSAAGTASGSAPTASPYSKGSADNSFHPTASDDISSMLVDVSDYGVTTSRAVGTNYSDDWYHGKMKFSGHYLFNSSSNTTDYDIMDQYFGETASDSWQQQRIDNDNVNHRFNAKYEYQITPRDYLLVRPSLSYQHKDELSDLSAYTVTSAKTDLLLNQKTHTDQNVTSTAGETMYLHRFGNNGHAISFDARGSYMHTYEDINMDFENVQTDVTALQYTMCKNNQASLSGMVSYILPVADSCRIKIDAGWNGTFGELHRRTDMKANGAKVFALDSLLSGSTWHRHDGFLGNASFMMSKRKINLVAGTEFQAYQLYNSNPLYYFQRNYKTLLPYLFVRYRFGGSQLNVQYKASRIYPGLLQVHDAINNTNAITAIRGSLRLEAGYSHNTMFRLVCPIQKTGGVFVLFGNYEHIDNYIGSMRSLSSESYKEDGERRNTEILSYVNTDGYNSCSALTAYGFPMKWLRSNVNISTQMKYTKTPGYWDNIKVFTNLWNWSGNFTLGSNISENVDFVLDVNGKYTNSTNAEFSDMNVDYWSLSYGGQLNWQFYPGLKLVAECGHTNYFGSNTAQYNALISNAAIAYKFLKGRKGELRLSINDIFDQDNSFYQMTTELCHRAVTTNILGRYAMLTFTYNLNTAR